MLLADPLSRDAAQQAARDELSKQEYADARPPLLLRIVARVLRAINDLFDGAASAFGSGALTRLLLVVLVAGVVVVVLVRLGPLRGGGTASTGAVFEGARRLTSAEHRELAEQAAEQGRWADAVRERLRALVRELEASGVVDARPGRTAAELARTAGAAAPELTDDLRRAAGTFDEVWYGGRPATPASYAVLAEVDERVRAHAGARATR